MHVGFVGTGNMGFPMARNVLKDLAHKDLGFALDLAGEAGERTDLVRQARQLYAEASKAGFGNLDSSGVLALLEPRSDASPQAESA